MRKTLHFEQKAMATLFEGWLCGEDVGHLRAVAQVLQEEILRIEQLLSKYDPSAELYRLNLAQARQPIKIERELWYVLANCLEWYNRTDGFFDIGISSSSSSSSSSKSTNYSGLANSLNFYKESSQILYTKAGTLLDLGGYGKGYALDKLAEILTEFGVEDFLIHGGKSSFLACGKKANGESWQVLIPYAETTQKEKLLGGCSFSSVHDKVLGISDIVHAETGKILESPLSCSVFAPSALAAEVLSTALLAMGKERGTHFMQKEFPDFKVQFIEKQAHGA